MCRSRLYCTDDFPIDEITAITSELTMPISSADVGVHITRITNDLPSQDDIERVQRRLEVRG